MNIYTGKHNRHNSCVFGVYGKLGITVNEVEALRIKFQSLGREGIQRLTIFLNISKITVHTIPLLTGEGYSIRILQMFNFFF